MGTKVNRHQSYERWGLAGHQRRTKLTGAKKNLADRGFPEGGGRIEMAVDETARFGGRKSGWLGGIVGQTERCERLETLKKNNNIIKDKSETVNATALCMPNAIVRPIGHTDSMSPVRPT